MVYVKFVCDRCRTFFEQKEDVEKDGGVYYISIENPIPKEWRRIESKILCKECAAQFDAFMEK